MYLKIPSKLVSNVQNWASVFFLTLSQWFISFLHQNNTMMVSQQINCSTMILKAHCAAVSSKFVATVRWVWKFCCGKNRSIGEWFAYQKRWPHMLTTASLAVSKQMLHSNIRSSFSFSSVVDPEGLDGPGCCSTVLISCNYFRMKTMKLIETLMGFVSRINQSCPTTILFAEENQSSSVTDDEYSKKKQIHSIKKKKESWSIFC